MSLETRVQTYIDDRYLDSAYARQIDETMSIAPPEMLYHYTNAEALKGILETRKLWATNLRYVNDPLELSYGVRLLHDIFRGLGRNKDKHMAEVGTECLELLGSEDNIVEKRYYSAYAASFSAEADDLGQYRAYADGGAGYCIGFSSKELLGLVQKNLYTGHEMRLYRIVYERDDQEKLIHDLLTHTVECTRQIASQFGEKERVAYMRRLCDQVITYIKPLVCFFKQPGFRSEREWRLGPDPHIDPGAHVLENITKIRVKNGVFIPYLELDLPESDQHPWPLKNITLGPKFIDRSAELGLFKLLLQQRLSSLVKIKTSGVRLT